jgi:hypothetical protein
MRQERAKSRRSRRARPDVDAVDAHGRGAEKTKRDGRLGVGDLDESNLGLDPQLRGESLDERPLLRRRSAIR